MKSGKKQLKSGKRTKLILVLVGLVLIIGAIFLRGFYQRVFSPNTNRMDAHPYLYIPTGSGFKDVVRLLQEGGYLKDARSFEWLAVQMKYDKRVLPGKYRLQDGMNNKDLITLLRSGKQEPVRLTIGTIRSVAQLSSLVGSRLEADSASIRYLFEDRFFLEKYGFSKENSLSVMVPNTYELYWNTSAEDFFKRMYKEYKRFWTENRLRKAESAGLKPIDVIVLASIVEKETNKKDEKPTIAGVYINRYKKGWKLEADPTLVYAIGDFTIRRVLNEHKEVDSPYNTYMYTGLPPGPICVPSIASIDAVLNYQKHDFMFFCAREDFSGYHAFARTYEQHLQNARRFQKELNKRGIRS